MTCHLQSCVIAAAAMLGTTPIVNAAAPPAVDQVPKLWVGKIQPREATINGYALSPDGHTLFTTGGGRIGLWDVRTGKPLRERFREDNEPSPTQTVFMSDGKMIACSGVGDLRTLELRSFVFRQLVTRNDARIGSLLASPKGSLVASSNGRILTMWDVARGKRLWRIEADTVARFSLYWMAFSPDGKVLAISGDYGPSDSFDVARLYDVTTGRELRRMSSARRGPQTGLIYSHDGRWLAACFRDLGQLQIWDAETGLLIRRVECRFEKERSCAWGLCLSPDGRTLFVRTSEGVRMYETATWQLRGVLEGLPSQFDVCPGDRLVWLDRGAGHVRIVRWREPGKPGRRTKEEMVRLWLALGSQDAAAAFRASAEMLGCPAQAVAKLGRIDGVEPVRPGLVARLVAGLNCDDEKVRDRAERDLAKAGFAAELPLRAVLNRQPGAELKQRVGRLLGALDEPDRQRLRYLRGVEILESIGSPEALKTLERLAGGAEGAELTQEAKRALTRRQARSN